MEKENKKYCYLVYQQKGTHYGHAYQVYSTKEGAVEAAEKFTRDERNLDYNPNSSRAYAKGAEHIHILQIAVDEYDSPGRVESIENKNPYFKCPKEGCYYNAQRKWDVPKCPRCGTNMVNG